MPMKKTVQTVSQVETVKMTELYACIRKHGSNRQTDRKTSEHTAGTT